MVPPSLLLAWDADLTLTVRDGALVVRPKTGVTPALRAALSADKPALLATLTTPTLYLNAALTYAAADLPATVADLRDWLAREDEDDLLAGRIGPSHLRAFVLSRLGLLREPDPMTTTTTEAA